MKHEAQRQVKPAVKPQAVVHRAEAKPAVEKPEPVAKNYPDAEAVRYRSVLEQVDADLAAGQIVTAHTRIRAALIHGTESEPTPL